MIRISCLACCGENDGESITNLHLTAEDSYPPQNAPVAEKLATQVPASISAPAKSAQSLQSTPFSRPLGSKQPGKPCTSRMPVLGDQVVSTGGKRTGHDTHGTPKAWVLMPWQSAKVIEVDSDGDFRLVNDSGTESGFMFRREFAYLADPNEATARYITDQSGTLIIRDSLFEVSLDLSQPGPDLGLVLDTLDPAAFEVLAVNSGVAMTYNQKVPEAKKLCFGDFIVGVNGVQNDRERMLAELKKSAVTLRVAPRIKFKVKFIKANGQTHGLVLAPQAPSQDSSTLLVREVKSGGCIDQYNRGAKAESKVQPGDRISDVNGIAGKPEVMLQELERCDDVEMTIGRPVKG
mmetsp:Transcript_74386/g.162687  ORF Transcript_74386/g.162687 Transcript_74386/m.162687 type:complete len:349 (+) Transcript_74386:128-1174(+)